MGYKRMEFYLLPSNKKCGSRELLIAIAWLIANEDMLGTLIHEKILDFNRQICVTNTCDKPKGENPEHWKKGFSYVDSLNYTLFLCKKLKNCLRSMYDYEEELIKLTNKVHQATQNISGVPHLSVDEASILLSKEVNPSVLKSALELRSILNTHLKWNACSSIFWKWMDTVLENAEKDSCEKANDDDEPVIEFIQVLLSCYNAKIRSVDEPKMAVSSDLGTFPRFIFQSSREQNKHSDLSALQNCVEKKLAVHKEAAKELEMELYKILKNIAETKLGPVVFVIPQMYAE
ncbi:tubulin epsilon and delta complex protein 1-like isoform X2 [Ischnura elegans]|nr:tubulin epsilon and delta complex protein 1-like isoform X2 [Ischnura elegans]XP_046402438.1 tubulin epsilon and delta complex protein 1-like isoform X2 [Ischnura elegans]